MSCEYRKGCEKGLGCGRKLRAGQGSLAGLCVNVGFHGMSETFELRSRQIVLPSDRHTGIVGWRRKGSQGRGKKMCEEGIATLKVKNAQGCILKLRR